MSDEHDTSMPNAAIKPRDELTIQFCPKCGRDDYVYTQLREKHYAFGKLCGGVLVTVKYVRQERRP